jgi:type IV pilus assembly protein PilC
MGLFPTKLMSSSERHKTKTSASQKVHGARSNLWFLRPRLRIKGKILAAFTRQLATLIEAGMPLLRGLHLLAEQTIHRRLKQIIGSIEAEIENGSSLTEALNCYPDVFDHLYLSMVKAGEISGALELSLKRLAEFMEKAQKIKGKVKAALFYPLAVLLVAVAIMALLMVFVLPKFKLVFHGLLNGEPLPAFTRFVFSLSEIVKNHFFLSVFAGGLFALAIAVLARTQRGGLWFDWFKIRFPVLGPVFKTAAIGRFARTFGTLSGNGVPVLQALTIVKETAGNVLISNVIAKVHENVKQGEPIAPTLKASSLFPVIISGMVDVGEQTGALPDMLIKIADDCDNEVENAANAMTSLLEPLLIVFLAIVVGSIVIAMFLPLIRIVDLGVDNGGGAEGHKW